MGGQCTTREGLVACMTFLTSRGVASVVLARCYSALVLERLIPMKDWVHVKYCGKHLANSLLMSSEAAPDNGATARQPLSHTCFSLFGFLCSTCTWCFYNALPSFGF
ncbi:hypothetical protein, unlikely [Trypanosoma congolense IL3000]|uniref:Uncharacterized protein n=1 Tax=Trypanosoma congolense (strain IL3000) TaxID=1068625 RepID=F9W917_TRYCI|nr:hypothetical protein, unlikely [Trypanosoma congolense IL3000]